MAEWQDSLERAESVGGCVAVYLRLRGGLARSSGSRRYRENVTPPPVAAPAAAPPRPGDLTRSAGRQRRRVRPEAGSECRGTPGRGPTQPAPTSRRAPAPPLYLLQLIVLVLLSSLVRIAECCSSRATPRPRNPSPSTRRPYTFQTEPCPEMYQEHYCLNGATCFKVNIGHSPLFNCECADGFMGQRCEFKDLDGSYLRSHDAVLETASIAGGAAVALLLVVVLAAALYVWSHSRSGGKQDRSRSNGEALPGAVECPRTEHIKLQGFSAQEDSAADGTTQSQPSEPC